MERLRGQGELLRGAVEARHHRPEGMGGGAEGVEVAAVAFARRAATIFAAHSARCSGVLAALGPLDTLASPPRLPSATAAGCFGVVMRSTPDTPPQKSRLAKPVAVDSEGLQCPPKPRE